MFSDPTFWAAVALFIFLGILLAAGVPGLIGRALDQRAARIEAELADARKLRDEARALLAEYQRKEREAEQQAKDVIDQANAEAQALIQEQRAALQEALARRTRIADERIARAEAQAVAEVRGRAVALAVAASEELIRTRGDGSQAQDMIAQSIAAIRKQATH